MIAGLIILTGLYAVLVGLWKRADPAKTLRVEDRVRDSLLISFLLLGISGKWLVNRDKAEGESALLLLKPVPYSQTPPIPSWRTKTSLPPRKPWA